MTPDSFSDGGRWFDHAAAVQRGLELFAEGADIVDVGGESTRPGADPVDGAEEARRVLPVVASLSAHGRVSVDTRHRGVAEAAVAAGATLVNDVSASLWEVAAEGGPGVGYVAVHMQGTPRTMQVDPRYTDVVSDVRRHLLDRAGRARAAGVAEVWIDPGIGFGKTPAHNLSLLKHLGALVGHGFAVMVGTSRKGFLQMVLGAPAGDVLEASMATAVMAIESGAGMVRVHDVRATVQAARLVEGALG